MKEIMVVTRITIGGQQYTAEELGEEKAKRSFASGWKPRWSRWGMKGRRNEEIR